MKIYTKKGDFGQTDLMSQRVSKDDPHIDLIGSIDEVMAHILILKYYITSKPIQEDLIAIHQCLFMMNYEIAQNTKKGYQTNDDDVTLLERRIDSFDQQLEPLTKFIRLDQNEQALWANMARVVCRRAERRFVDLANKQEMNEISLKYLNRLSDYLFTLGRFVYEIKEN